MCFTSILHENAVCRKRSCIEGGLIVSKKFQSFFLKNLFLTIAVITDAIVVEIATVVIENRSSTMFRSKMKVEGQTKRIEML